jgi:hypothetical protein
MPAWCEKRFYSQRKCGKEFQEIMCGFKIFCFNYHIYYYYYTASTHFYTVKPSTLHFRKRRSKLRQNDHQLSTHDKLMAMKGNLLPLWNLRAWLSHLSFMPTSNNNKQRMWS